MEDAPAVPESPDRQAPEARQPDAAPGVPSAPAEGVRSMAETLPSALEPELRRIIDTAVARVAAIELDAIREARELTQRSEQEAREALKFALDRAFNLIATLELLAATVGGMAEALKIELDDAIDALRKVPEPESELAKEMAAQQAPAPQEAPAAQEAPPAPATEEPAPAPAPEAVTPAPETEAAAEPEPAPEAEPEPEPEPERPVAEVATAPEAEKPEAAAPAEEEEAPRTNGYPPAERQAQSLAQTAQPEPQPEPEPEPEPERTVVRAPASEDGRPAVPNRRRGFMRRLLSK